MITSTSKSFETVLENLKGENKLFLVGCGDCATICKTGDEDTVKAMKAKLEENGKTVTGWIVVTPACNVGKLRKEFKAVKQQIDDSDSILVMSCGLCVAAVIDAVEQVKPVHPGTDTGFGGETIRFGQFTERCSMCGECILEDTGGICPVTMCSKGLLNGPCGGYKNGKCEVDPELDCGWMMIYERLGKLNKLDKMEPLRKPKNFAKWKRPRKLVLTDEQKFGKKKTTNE
ncbi:MAG: methylenetetrahydrofolate reductase C-terminal domain-containing protein [Planctomycetes bacterium]|nr:methylenetetrahydrofolate reductase C-terminal domain-containing protein [Planctomycetota bacterium]